MTRCLPERAPSPRVGSDWCWFQLRMRYRCCLQEHSMSHGRPASSPTANKRSSAVRNRRNSYRDSLHSRLTQSQHPSPWTAVSRRARTRPTRQQRDRGRHQRPGGHGVRLRSIRREQRLHRPPPQSTIRHRHLPPRAHPPRLPIGTCHSDRVSSAQAVLVL